MPKPEKVRVNVKERVEHDNTIDLSLSELTEVPVRDIASFRRVTVLDLSNNKIVYLGKNFTSLTHLIQLDLSKNQIRTLPEDFGNLRSLRRLDLYNNRIERLPLSFGNLHNLRYLDLKANPLVPALSKIVGQCLTTKDCNESARNTVKFLCQMQKEMQKLKEESDAQIEAIEDVKKPEIQKPKKKKNKKKSKNQKPESPSSKFSNNKTTNSKGKSCDSAAYNDSDPKLNTVLKTLFVFVFLLAINIIMFYIITVKNPEIAEKLVGIISPHYRELILTKTEHMKLNFLRLSDWLQKFRTPPT